jgi:cytoskeletal protein RodZ
MLDRLAKQLASLDEASLMSLWDRYYERVRSFEPTEQWERAVLILGMLQTVRWKNQLFNAKWRSQRKAPQQGQGDVPAAPKDRPEAAGPASKEEPKELRGKVIRFEPKKNDDPE